MQIHDRGNGGRPPFSFRAEDAFSIMINGGSTAFTSNNFVPVPFTDGSLNRGRWVDFVFRIVWHDSGGGAVTVWRRDEGESAFEQVADRSGLSTLKPCVDSYYWKTGLYRNRTTAHTNVLHLDGFNWADSYEAVVAHAFGR